jgi:hypothetical protein
VGSQHQTAELNVSSAASIIFALFNCQGFRNFSITDAVGC